MQSLSRWIFTGILLFVGSYPLAAQETISDENKTKQEEARQKALEALELLIVESRSLKLPENRAVLLSSSVALLWPYKEKAARELIPEITENIKQMFTKADENTNQSRFYYLRKSIREQAINTFAKVDLELALELLRATRPTFTHEATNKDFFQSEINLEQNLANQVATHNVEAALKLAEQSLEKGFSYNLQNLLTTILKKSPQKATPLLDKIFKKLQTTDLLSNEQALIFSASFLENELRAHKKELSKGQQLYGIQLREPALSKDELKKWTEVFVRAHLQLPNRPDLIKKNPYLLQWLLRIRPFLEFSSPELLAPVNSLLAKVQPKLNDDAKENLESNLLMVEGKVDELIALAEKMPTEKKDQYLWNAIHTATDYHGDPDLASKIIDRYVTSEDKKKEYRSFVAWFASYVLADQGKIDEVIASFAHIPSDIEKARTLTRIAENNVKTKAAKIQLLDKALQYLTSGIETSEPFSAFCQIVGVYAQVDSEHAFALFEPQIDPMNRVWEAAASYCTFDAGFVCLARKGELLMSPNFASSRYLFDVFGAVRGLAKVNYSRTYELTQRIKSPEIKSQSLLAIIESQLARIEEK